MERKMKDAVICSKDQQITDDARVGTGEITVIYYLKTFAIGDDLFRKLKAVRRQTYWTLIICSDEFECRSDMLSMTALHDHLNTYTWSTKHCVGTHTFAFLKYVKRCTIFLVKCFKEEPSGCLNNVAVGGMSGRLVEEMPSVRSTQRCRSYLTSIYPFFHLSVHLYIKRPPTKFTYTSL